MFDIKISAKKKFSNEKTLCRGELQNRNPFKSNFLYLSILEIKPTWKRLGFIRFKPSFFFYIYM